MYLSILQNPADFDQELRKRRQECSQKGITFQPVLVFIGTPGQFAPYHLAADDIVYDLENALDALNFAFQFFFATDVKYPSACIHIWTLIQLAFYDIKTPFDVTGPQMLTALANLR